MTLSRAKLIADGIGQGFLDFLLVDGLAKLGVGKGLGDARGGVGTQISLDQHFFQLIEFGLV